MTALTFYPQDGRVYMAANDNAIAYFITAGLTTVYAIRDKADRIVWEGNTASNAARVLGEIQSGTYVRSMFNAAAEASR